MRHVAWMMLLSAGAAMAQPARDCKTCAQAGQCEASRAACVAECRAGFFTIDPRRDACVAACSAEQARCVKNACGDTAQDRTCR